MRGIANSDPIAIQAYNHDDVVRTPGVRTRPSMVVALDNEAVTYVNSKMGFGSLRIVKIVDPLICISNIDLEEGHR